MSKKEIIEKLRTYSNLEEEYGLKLVDITGFENDYVEMLIQSIGYDSRKHAGLYRAAADILEGKSMSIVATKFEELTKQLEEHIVVEKQMLENVKELIEQIEDERVKAILQTIEEDEKVHHPLMERIIKTVIKPEILEDQDVWMMMFGMLPRHGHALDPYADIDSPWFPDPE
jgi:ribonucleotide reductase beta subunit family protein with ferritin-like domain